MSKDDIDHIPSIVPSREDVGERNVKRSGGASRRGDAAKPAQRAGAGLLAQLFIMIALAAAGVACAWAWQLQQALEQAQVSLDNYAGRIGELEARLSDTDEGMTQNATLQAAKIRELDSEVRKLWDNVWKASKKRLEALESSTSKHGKELQAARKSLASLESELQAASADIVKFQSVAGDMSRLMASAKASQAEVERVADTLNRINLDMSKLDKRVTGNEEWVASINAFRRQINASLTELQAAVRAPQGATTPAP